MELGKAMLAVGAGERAASFEEFSAAIDPQWITAALAATGTASLRRRKLPAEYVVWLVIGMALFRDRAIRQVVQHLDLVLPSATGGRGAITPGAIVQARTRLGPQPLAALFRHTADVWAGAAAAATRWRGLAVYAVDGTTLRVPDTRENDATFGRPGTSRGGAAGYPQWRLVVLLVRRHHLVAAAALGPYAQSEPALAATLWPQRPDDSVVILDRGFTAYALFQTLGDPARGRHWLVRVRAGRGALRWTVRQRLGAGDALVAWTPAHKQRTVGRNLPATLPARAVRVQRRGFRPVLLLTSLLDPVAYPAAALGALYHERWEIELAFDEVKTHTLERAETLRSHAPARVEQEVWGLLLGYNLVRVLMARAAPHAGVPPLRLSYWNAVLLLRGFWHSAWYLPPGTLPRHLDMLLHQLALLVIPARRERRYPRAVKLTHTRSPRKRPKRRSRRARRANLDVTKKSTT